MSLNPCPKCSSDRPGLEDACPNCGWSPGESHEEREPLPLGRPVAEAPQRVQFGLSQLLQVVTVVALWCAACRRERGFARKAERRVGDWRVEATATAKLARPNDRRKPGGSSAERHPNLSRGQDTDASFSEILSRAGNLAAKGPTRVVVDIRRILHSVFIGA